MAKVTSFFIDIISARADELLIERKEDFIIEIQKAVEDGKRVFKIRSMYNFKSNIHIQLSNINSAPYSKGCGCEYCLARHHYAEAKLRLHRKTKSFDAFMDGGYYPPEREVEPLILKFNQERNESLEEIKILRNRMREIKQQLISIDLPIF